MNQCIAQKTVVPDELLGELVDSTTLLRQPTDLRASLAADGYVLLRGVVGPAEVQAAREEVFGRLADVGEIRHPPGEGIATGQSRRKELVADLGSVCLPGRTITSSCVRDARDKVHACITTGLFFRAVRIASTPPGLPWARCAVMKVR